MNARFRFLGTGASSGVPQIGCVCAVCRSSSPFNKRLRSAGLFTIDGRRYLIDAGPDFRQMALMYHIDRLQGVMLTHAHADHIAGIDDLRVYYFLEKRKLPCLLSQETYDQIAARFPYLLELTSGKSTPAQLDFRILNTDFGSVDFEGLALEYMTYFQLDMKVTGFRFGSFAYVSDIRTYSEEIFESLEGVEILVLSALRHVSTAMHFSIEEAIAFSRRVRSKTTYFTHIAHDLDHETAQKILPKGFHLSYDGLEISIHA